MTTITIRRPGVQGATGARGGAGSAFTFATSTAMAADPGAGALRFDNADPALVTAAVISNRSAATGNPDVSDAIASYATGTSAVKARMIVRSAANPDTAWREYDVTAITDAGAWLALSLTYRDHAGTFAAADALDVAFFARGDKGNDGEDGVDGVDGAMAPMVIALSNNSGPFTAAEGVFVFYAPVAMTISRVFARLATAQASGNAVIVDVRRNGASIFSTRPTIPNGQTISPDGVIPGGSVSFAVGDAIAIDRDQVGDGTGRGLTLYMLA